MKILALESSAVAASAALCEDEMLLGQTYLHTGLTHSQTLLPMAAGLLEQCGLKPQDLDLIAVAAGPGSFTGLRIGVAAAKGLAWAAELPCAGCSTLEAMAWSLAGFQGEVCAAMDARRHQVYNARFQVNGTAPHRLTPDRAIALADLVKELEGTSVPQIIVGDGAQLCYDALTAAGIPAILAPPNLRMQSAWGVARMGLELARTGQTVSPGELVPMYHRLSQAERERLEREEAAELGAPEEPEDRVGDGHRHAVGHDKTDAGVQRLRAERRQHGRDLEVADEEAVERAARHGDEERQQHRQRRGKPRLADENAEEHSAQAASGADGQIHAAGDHRRGHRQRQKSQLDHLAEQAHGIRQCQEVIADDGEYHEHEKKHKREDKLVLMRGFFQLLHYFAAPFPLFFLGANSRSAEVVTAMMMIAPVARSCQ